MSHFDDIDSMPPGPFNRVHSTAGGQLLTPVVAYTPEAMTVEITKNGVMVGGHLLPSVTQWEILRHYGEGVTEVKLTLVASKLSVDLAANQEQTGRSIL